MLKTIIIFLISAAVVLPQSAGKSGLSFLKMGAGARNIAMGDAGAVFANDVTSIFYNPAGLAQNPGYELFFMHNEWIQDVRSETAGAGFLLFNIPFAAGFNVTTISDIEVRRTAGAAETTINANYFSGSLSTGFNLTRDISFGASIKYLYEGILNDEANGLGFDFGMIYRTPLEGLTASASVKNLGSMNNLRDEATVLPTEVRAGAAYSHQLEQSPLRLTGGVEVQSYTAAGDIHILGGVEAVYKGTAALRAGYQSGYDSKNFTAGAGLIWGNLKFDYAFQPFRLGLGSANILSIQFRF